MDCCLHIEFLVGFLVGFHTFHRLQQNIRTEDLVHRSCKPALLGCFQSIKSNWISRSIDPGQSIKFIYYFSQVGTFENDALGESNISHKNSEVLECKSVAKHLPRLREALHSVYITTTTKKKRIIIPDILIFQH